MLQRDPAMNKIAHGIIHGNTIELKTDLGLLEDQEVEETIKFIKQKRPWGEGICNTAGTLASDPSKEDDKIDELYRQRKCDTGRELPG